MTSSFQREKLEGEFSSICNSIQNELKHIEKSKQELAEQMEEFEGLRKKLETLSSNMKNKVKLNIGGQIFTSTKDTLTSEPGTFFCAMFSELFNTKPDEDGEYFIDRDPDYFPLILKYLRNPTKKIAMNELTTSQIEELIEEARFYQIDGLINMLTKTSQVVELLESLGGYALRGKNYKITISSSGGESDLYQLAHHENTKRSIENNYGSKKNWLQIEILNECQFRPLRYKIIQENDRIMRNWKLEASKSGDHWIILKEHINDQSISAKALAAEWDISSQDYYKKFRITSDGDFSIIRLMIFGHTMC